MKTKSVMSPKHNGIPTKLKYIDEQEKAYQLENSASNLGPESVQVNCQNCHSNVSTITEPDQKKGCLAGWAICCLGLWIPCFWCCIPCLPCVAAIPCFMKECQDIAHTCPNCGTLIGTYNGLKMPQ